MLKHASEAQQKEAKQDLKSKFRFQGTSRSRADFPPRDARLNAHRGQFKRQGERGRERYRPHPRFHNDDKQEHKDASHK